MDANNLPNAAEFQVGDRVRIRYYKDMRGRVVELRGPLGPGGCQIYGVRYRLGGEMRYIEVRGDQLIRLRKREPIADPHAPPDVPTEPQLPPV